MLTLIWSTEQSVREEVVENFSAMYFHKLSDDGKKLVPQQPQVIAINLVALVSGASLAVITSLEEILGTVTHSGVIEHAVVKALWELVGLPLQQKQKDATLHDRQMIIARGAMCVLAMIARADSEIISTPTGLTRIREVLSTSFDLRLARHACTALQAYATFDPASVTPTKAKLMEEMVTLAAQLVRGCVWMLCALGASIFFWAGRRPPNSVFMRLCIGVFAIVVTGTPRSQQGTPTSTTAPRSQRSCSSSPCPRGRRTSASTL